MHQIYKFNILFSDEPKAVEPLNVPEGAKPGDVIKVEGYDGAPDAQLNPKKKVRLTTK